MPIDKSQKQMCAQDCPHWHRQKGDRYCLTQCIRPNYFTGHYYHRPDPLKNAEPIDDIIRYLPDIPLKITANLQELPLRQATIIIQRHYLSCTLKEISQYHKISIARVKQILSQAINKLNKIL